MVPIIFTPIVNSIYKSSIRTDDRAKRTFLLCCGAFLFIMIAFRSQYVGTEDSQRYYLGWLSIREVSSSFLDTYLKYNELEPGYILTVWALSRVFPNPQMLFVLSGLLFTISICRFIYKNSDDYCMSFVLNALLMVLSYGCCMLGFGMNKAEKEMLKSITVYAIKGKT